MPINIDQVVNLGGAQVLIGAVDVGHTDDTGVKVTVKNAIVEAKAGKYGDAPVGKWINGQRAEVEFNLIQTSGNFSALASAIPGATVVTNGAGDKKLTFGKVAGTKLIPVTLRLKPYPAGLTPGLDFVAAKAVAIGDFELMYTGNQIQVWKCKFELTIDEAGGADGSFLFTFGDPTISADLTAPTVTTVVPADAAVAVSVATLITWTLSENLDGNTVVPANVKIFKDPTGVGPTGLQVAGTAVLTNAGAGTTIVFTPTAPLAALTKYLAVLEDVKDVAGNSLANGFYATEFTTA